MTHELSLMAGLMRKVEAVATEEGAAKVTRISGDRVYTLDEITAEKFRCLIQRLPCRDPYDIHELLVELRRGRHVW